jgi:hypothetical protein
MKKISRTKLFLAGYFWDDDESCVSFTRSKGYGIVKPNGEDLSVDVMPLGMCSMSHSLFCAHCSVIAEQQL